MRTTILTLTVGVLVGVALVAQQPTTPKKPATKAGAGHQATVRRAMSARYDDLKWQTIVPELGDDSPQISILRVDPKTHATQLLIRVPKQPRADALALGKRFTHTVIRGTWVFEHEGTRDQLGPGGFNYMPAKMHHQAWASDDALVFVNVDAAWDINWVTGPPSKADLGKTPDK